MLHSKFDTLWEGAPKLASKGIGSNNEILNLNAAACSYFLVDTPSVTSTDVIFIFIFLAIFIILQDNPPCPALPHLESIFEILYI